MSVSGSNRYGIRTGPYFKVTDIRAHLALSTEIRRLLAMFTAHGIDKELLDSILVPSFSLSIIPPKQQYVKEEDRVKVRNKHGNLFMASALQLYAAYTQVEAILVLHYGIALNFHSEGNRYVSEVKLLKPPTVLSRNAETTTHIAAMTWLIIMATIHVNQRGIQGI